MESSTQTAVDSAPSRVVCRSCGMDTVWEGSGSAVGRRTRTRCVLSVALPEYLEDERVMRRTGSSRSRGQGGLSSTRAGQTSGKVMTSGSCARRGFGVEVLVLCNVFSTTPCFSRLMKGFNAVRRRLRGMLQSGQGISAQGGGCVSLSQAAIHHEPLAGTFALCDCFPDRSFHHRLVPQP